MPRVFIPPLMQSLTNGEQQVDASGSSVRQVIDDLESRFPGIRGRLCDGDDLKPGLTVAIDENISNLGLLQKVADDSEVHFLPAIGGG